MSVHLCPCDGNLCASIIGESQENVCRIIAIILYFEIVFLQVGFYLPPCDGDPVLRASNDLAHHGGGAHGLSLHWLSW